MTKVITVSNQKGGVAKTTTSLNFAVELGNREYKVLLIDFDTQGNLSRASGAFKGENIDLLEDTIATSINDLINDNDFGLYIYKTGNKNVEIIPCNISMAQTKMMLSLALARESMMKKIVERIKRFNSFDYIIIDSAPSLDIDLINCFVASDEVLITATPDTFSLSGTKALIDSINKVKNNLNSNLKIAGVLVTQVDRRTNFAKDMVYTLRGIWGNEIDIYNTEIPISVKIKESQAVGMAISEYEKNNKVAVAYSSFTDEYLNKSREAKM